MNLMTSEFYKAVEELFEVDSRVIVLLGASGVGFPNEFTKKYPDRFIDAGIMEQSIVSMAAGMAIGGAIPIFYAQTPFIVERAYEQLKVDFGYQKLGGNFVGYGASTENGLFGATHCCPADVSVLSMIPGMEIVVPGRPDEFRKLFLQSYDDGKPTYFRITRYCNSYSKPVEFGKANIVRRGKKATVIAVGPMLELVEKALKDEDVTILYYSTVVPFDSKTLLDNISNDRVLVCEPYYIGSTMSIISKVLEGRMIKMEFVGYPLTFIVNHGYVVDNLHQYQMDSSAIKAKYLELVKSC